MAGEKPIGLLRVLGFGFGIAMVVGNAVGAGILKMPGTVAGYITNDWVAICLWIVAGGLSLAGAYIYAEVSTAYPFSGGPYVISEKVFGSRAAFTVGVCDWVLNSAGNAALAVASAEFITSIYGNAGYNNWLAIVIIFILSTMQWFGTRSSSITQQALSLLKALGIMALVTAFFMHGRATSATAIAHSAPSISFFTAVVLASRAILFAYASWNSPIYFAEENSNPARDLPRSLIYGVLSLTIIYVLVNWAVLHVLPSAAIADSPLAVADGALVVFGPAGKTIVTVISIVIALSSLYGGILYAPRIIFSISRSGLFFPFASQLNAYSIPAGALIVTTIITILFTLTGTFAFITSIFIFLYVFIDTSVYLSAIYSRWKNLVNAPFKAPAFPLLHLFMILVNAALLISVFIEDWKSSTYALLIILCTVPLYYVSRVVAKASLIRHS